MREGTSLAVQWFRLCTSNAGGTGSIPGRGTKIPYAARRGQKINLKIIKCEGEGRIKSTVSVCYQNYQLKIGF